MESNSFLILSKYIARTATLVYDFTMFDDGLIFLRDDNNFALIFNTITSVMFSFF